MDRKKRLCTLALATIVICGIWSFTLAGDYEFLEPAPGEMGYLHGKFHDLYMHLTRTEGDEIIDCCSGQDCRATLDLKPPSAKEASNGVVGLVFVDGLWCPVEKYQLVDLPQSVRMRGSYDPHVQEFQNLTHVCAGVNPLAYFRPKSPRPKPEHCPAVFCVKEGGAKS